MDDDMVRMSISQVARALGISPTYVRDLINAGRLPGTYRYAVGRAGQRRNGIPRIPISAVLSFTNSLPEPPNDDDVRRACIAAVHRFPRHHTPPRRHRTPPHGQNTTPTPTTPQRPTEPA